MLSEFLNAAGLLKVSIRIGTQRFGGCNPDAADSPAERQPGTEFEAHEHLLSLVNKKAFSFSQKKNESTIFQFEF